MPRHPHGGRPQPTAKPASSPLSRPGRQRDLLLQLWARTRQDWGFAATRLYATLRAERWLGSHDRHRVAETLFGMVRQARRIEVSLGDAGSRDRPLAELLAYEVLSGDLSVAEARAELGAIDWERVAKTDERSAREPDAGRRLGQLHSLPDWLARRLLEHGDDALPLAAALNERAPLTLRTNTLRATRDALLESLADDGIDAWPTRHASAGVIVEGHPDVWSLRSYKQGWFEVQDEGSQLICELVAPPPRSLVIDACAGGGGKTLALGALMQSKGRLLATDTEAAKLEELRRRARKAGLSSVRAIPAEVDRWPAAVEELSGRADRVLVDAPCTGTGALRRNPEMRWRLTEEDAGRFAALQESIAARALDLVAPGGRLIYATCSLLRDENERVVETLLADHQEFELMRAAEIWGSARATPICDASVTFLHTMPHRHGMDGFFAAVLRRRT